MPDESLRTFRAGVLLHLLFLGPFVLNNESFVSDTAPDLLCSVRRERSHHSRPRLQHSSQNSAPIICSWFLWPESSIVPGNIVVELVENNIDRLPYPQPVQRSCRGVDRVAQTADHPPVERRGFRFPSCLLRA